MAVRRRATPGSRAIGATAPEGFISIDATGMTELFGALRNWPEAVKVSLREAGMDAAEIVADTAKRNAAFSSWIPEAIVAEAPLTRSTIAAVRVDSSKAPSPDHAPLPRLEEFGAPFFRHPVFGDRDAWVSQPAHPFLFPALREEEPAVYSRLELAVQEAAAAVGLSMSA